MQDRSIQSDLNPQNYPVDLESDTARWTSDAYNVRFDKIGESTQQDFDVNNFRMSAWGLSTGLAHLLQDYTPQQLENSLNWLISNQNPHMIALLNQAIDSGDMDYSSMDHIFIGIDTELYLRDGLRMHVICVTNIVQIDAERGILDKFVAVLDPGEADHYIRERRGMTFAKQSPTIH